MARPKFKIDYEMVEKLAGIQCTQQESFAVYIKRDKKTAK